MKKYACFFGQKMGEKIFCMYRPQVAFNFLELPQRANKRSQGQHSDTHHQEVGLQAGMHIMKCTPDNKHPSAKHTQPLN